MVGRGCEADVMLSWERLGTRELRARRFNVGSLLGESLGRAGRARQQKVWPVETSAKATGAVTDACSLLREDCSHEGS